MLKVVHELNPIFVKTADVPITKTRQAFIRNFLANKAMTTYENLSCTQVQCRPGANRSISEIHRITLSRFPKTSFDAIIRIIKDLIDHDGCYRMTYCTTINKVVLMYTSKAERKYISPNATQYFTKVGVDGYSIEMFENEIKKLN